MLNREEDILQAAEDWQKAGHGVALATVVETWGSAPRPAGSSLVINDDGTFLGSVSGGCVEGAVVTEALDVIATLDAPTWAALLGLVDEFPVLHAAVGALLNGGVQQVSASAFEFISENSQISSVRQFMESLPDRLRS